MSPLDTDVLPAGAKIRFPKTPRKYPAEHFHDGFQLVFKFPKTPRKALFKFPKTPRKALFEFPKTPRKALFNFPENSKKKTAKPDDGCCRWQAMIILFDDDFPTTQIYQTTDRYILIISDEGDADGGSGDENNDGCDNDATE